MNKNREFVLSTGICALVSRHARFSCFCRGNQSNVPQYYSISSAVLVPSFDLFGRCSRTIRDAAIDNQMNAQGISTNFTGDWSFTARGMKSSVLLKGTAANSNDRDELWQAEVMIPFADLGVATPKAKSVWRGNFYRFNRTKSLPPELLSWSPTRLPGFHQPSRFGYLEFGE